ncbi:GAF domain-containing protein [Robertmurraya massiliosenegalensis]|uniref:GAF domain-containing protein n=1 Tax=Robertmurraya massiliosenegalensis TaxID=1287657 RepID=UPI00030ED7C4|nr:GAF domain-containing protein [Robertmurraya massiliosenegalensis]
MNTNLEQNQSELESEDILNIPKYSIGKWIGCYALSLTLVLVIIFGLTEGIVRSVKALTSIENISAMKIITFVSVIYFIFRITKNLGDHWRSNENVEIGTSVTGFPNIFYDAKFQKGPLRLQREYQRLYSEYRKVRLNLEYSRNLVKDLSEHINNYVTKLRVLLRHNDNANRLIRSYNYLNKEQPEQLYKKMLKEILSECVTILEKDQADKSISLFKVNGDKLEIAESIRINAESVTKRFFEINQGFAGHIWSISEAEIVNNVDVENDERFNDFHIPTTPIGSILGFPLKVDDQIVGVLCLQSEAEEGFSNSDLRTVEFYARLCTMVIMYDTINLEIDANKGGDPNGYKNKRKS